MRSATLCDGSTTKALLPRNANTRDPTEGMKIAQEGHRFALAMAILWPNGLVCPHCGNSEEVYAVRGKSARPEL
jgi:hypothetical protein